MNCVINMSNHSPLGQRSLEDPAAIIAHQLRALGHGVERIDGMAPMDGGLTIVFEGWIDEACGAELAAACRRGVRLLIIATEQPTAKGFNHGIDPHFVRRQEVFPHVAAHAEAIWCLVPGSAAWYGQWGPPAVEVELGWAATLERRGPEPTSEFCFFGNLTDRRKRLLERLRKQLESERHSRGDYAPFTAVRACYFSVGSQRDLVVSSGKVLPLMRAFEPMGLVSSSRISTTLHLGRPVVAEPHELDQNWRHIVEFAPSGQFLRQAVAATRKWRSLHKRQMKAFRAAMSPEQQVGRALRATGLVERSPRSAAA